MGAWAAEEEPWLHQRPSPQQVVVDPQQMMSSSLRAEVPDAPVAVAPQKLLKKYSSEELVQSCPLVAAAVVP